MKTDINIEKALRIFAHAGGTDEPYLRHHWPRYTRTRDEIERTRPLESGAKILDVGAHWLHQAVIYAHQGMQVTALDLPATLTLENVRQLAANLGVVTLIEPSLDTCMALREIPDNHFDLVLFTEIVEHITFNPVAMWRQIYRVTKPGGRIVVTTPNYYALRGRLWHPRRFFNRFGGGLETSEILNLNTHAHHWKEYSMRELIYYFCLLSADFVCIKAEYIEEYCEGYLGVPPNRAQILLERHIRILRPCLHLEVEIKHKSQGITLEPHW